MALTKIVDGIEYTISPVEEQELRNEWAAEAVKKQLYIDTLKYKDDRRRDYLPIGEQLDAILKQLNYMQINGYTNLIVEMEGIIENWLAVKAKYPKPEIL